MQTKNDFGFIFTVKFGFLTAKLNLSFGLGVVLKNSTKDLHVFGQKLSQQKVRLYAITEFFWLTTTNATQAVKGYCV